MSQQRKVYTNKELTEIRRQNMAKAREARKQQAALRKMGSLLDDIVTSHNKLKNEIDKVAKTVEEQAKDILLNKFKAKDFIKVIGNELVMLYQSAGGREALAKYLRKKPDMLFKVLTTIADISLEMFKIEEGNNSDSKSTNNGVMVQFIGLENKDKNVVVSSKGEEDVNN